MSDESLRVVVTGARGAIGRHVVRRARARGHTVLGLGHGSWVGDADLPPIDRWIRGSIDGDTLSAVLGSEGPPDAVLHLAGGSHVGASIGQPGEDFRRTVESGQRLLEWLRLCAPRARLVIASSAAVYGNGRDECIPESAPIAPISPYGTHKACLDLLARTHANQYGLNIAVLRFFSVYGPGLRKQLLWDICTRLLNGEQRLTLGGTGAEERDFLYIEDAADMLIDAISLCSPRAPVFNGATGEGTSVETLARILMMHFEGTAVAFSGDSRPGDPKVLVGDPTAARNAGLCSPTSLNAGIARTVKWIRRQRDLISGNAQ